MPDKSLAPLYDAENECKEEVGNYLPFHFRLTLGTWDVRHVG